MKYKVIKEYNRFYLCESKNGYLECFNKYNYKIDAEGYVYKFRDELPESFSQESKKERNIKRKKQI